MSVNLPPVLARVPAFGVRLFRPGGERTWPLRLEVLDEGGHGYPWEVLLLRLQEEGDDLKWLLPGHEVHWDTGLAGVRRVQPAGTFRYGITIEREVEWPAGCSHLLLVLSHVTAAHGLERRDPEKAPPYSHEELIDAVRRCLLQPRHVLERALIEQPRRHAASAVGVAPAVRPSDKLHFALGSCQYPHDIFDRMPEVSDAQAGPADASLLRLASLLDGDAEDRPSLVILCGDQVYLDATAGLFDPKVLSDRVRRPYELLFGGRGAQKVFSRADVQIWMLPDDHEIVDNYAPQDRPGDAQSAQHAKEAISAWWHFQRGERANDKLWRQMSHRGVAFFLADTRTERGPRSSATVHSAKIMAREQWKALRCWLLLQRDGGRPCFIATPSIALPRRLMTAHEPAQALMSDAWDGYPASLHRLLGFICANQIQNVVLLSGDEHLSCHAVIELRDSNGHQVRLHSIHSSALYAPYPFANGVEELLADEECFHFRYGGANFSCAVNTTFAEPGDGFATIAVRQEAARWLLDLRYFSGTGPKKKGDYTLELTS